MDITNGNCEDVCPQTGYYINEQNRCKNCHSSCQNCAGSNISDCISCPINKYLLTTSLNSLNNI